MPGCYWRYQQYNNIESTLLTCLIINGFPFALEMVIALLSQSSKWDITCQYYWNLLLLGRLLALHEEHRRIAHSLPISCCWIAYLTAKTVSPTWTGFATALFCSVVSVVLDCFQCLLWPMGNLFSFRLDDFLLAATPSNWLTEVTSLFSAFKGNLVSRPCIKRREWN